MQITYLMTSQTPEGGDVYLCVNFLVLVLEYFGGNMTRIQSFIKGVVFCVLILCAWGPLGHAQSVNDYVSMGRAPSWVDVQTAPTKEFALGNENTKIYRLVDWQVKLGKTNSTKYKHYVTTLLSTEAVQDNSLVEITFDPSFQTIQLHDITIIRDGTRFNRLNLAKFKLINVETDESRLIYNGRLRASLIIPDVRVGDTLDYSYSISGRNPAVKSHFSYYSQLQYSAAVQKIHERVLIENSISVNTQAYANAPEPKITKMDKYTSYEWTIHNSPGKASDDNQPSWFNGYPSYRFSSFKNWRHVGQYFSKYYETPKTIPTELQKTATEIDSLYNGKEQKMRAALAYVQDEIRYLGIEIGAGGFVPRTPKQTLEQRFGDCKDMSLVLLTLLKKMKIEAVPILVNSETRGGVDEVIANHGAFDHVLVRADINGVYYYLDATRGPQLGDTDHFEQGWYDAGLIVSSKSRGLVYVDIDGPTWWKVFEDKYDMVSDPGTVLLTSISSYYGAQSDSMLSWSKRKTREGVEQSFLEFFQNTYPTIEQTKPLEIEVNDQEAIITFTGHYSIPNAWTNHDNQKIKTFSAYASELDSDFPDFVGVKRTTPYAMSHPIRTKQVISFKLDDTWSFDDEYDAEKNNAFEFSKKSAFKNNIYKQTYTFTTLSDQVTAMDFEKIMSKIKDIDSELGVELQVGTGLLSGDGGVLYEQAFSIAIIGAALIALFFALVFINSDEKLRQELIFYPVRINKFLLMSFISIGVYQYYWIYKNWMWLKTVEGKLLSPVWRTIFAPIMNFSLIGHMAQHEKTGYSWFLVLSLPIAILYFAVNVFGRIVDRIDTLPDWYAILSFLSILILVPVAMQVNKMNEERQELIDQNSKFTWHSCALLALFMPAFIMTMFGIIVILGALA